MIEIILERKLYAQLSDQEYYGILKQLQGFAGTYVNEIPSLKMVLIFDTRWQKYVMMGIFGSAPTQEEREQFSCLCTELTTYDSLMLECDNFSEKIFYPGVVTDAEGEMIPPSEPPFNYVYNMLEVRIGESIKTDSNLSVHNELIRSYLNGEMNARCFSRLYEKLYLNTSDVLPSPTMDLISRLYVLARDWDDPDKTFRTKESDLKAEATKMLDILGNLQAAVYKG